MSEITFDELDRESILLLSKIGFWNKICLQKIAESHLLTQNDESVFNELKHLSAHVEYYIAYHKKNKRSFEFISKDMKNFD